MNGLMKWPPASRPVTQLVKMQSAPDQSWNEHRVQVMRFYDTFPKARTAVSRFMQDSNYETEGSELPLKRRRIIRPQRFAESSSDEEIPVRKHTTSAPAPPPVTSSSHCQSNSGTAPRSAPSSCKATRKGEGPSVKELRKKDREELLERLKAARAAAAAKIKSPLCRATSPWKVEAMIDSSQHKSPQKTSSPGQVVSAWKETSRHNSKDASHHSPVEHSQFCDDLEYMFQDIDDPPEVTVDLTTSSKKGAQSATQKSPPIVKAALSAMQKSPTFKSFSELPDNVAFCLSPASAKAVSNGVRNSKKSSGVSASGTSVISGEGAAAIPLKSKVDGRRQLFSVEPKTDSERLTAIEASLLTLETMMRETSSKTDIVLMNLGRVQRALLPSEKRIAVPHNMPSLPLGTYDDLKNFEKFLKESDTNLAAVCDYLSSFIRTTVVDPERKSANSILKKLMFNNLAKQCNLDGGNNKIGFRSLHIYKAFQGTLQTAFKDSDLTVADDALHKWLKDAKKRKQAVLSSHHASPRKSTSKGKSLPAAA